MKDTPVLAGGYRASFALEWTHDARESELVRYVRPSGSSAQYRSRRDLLIHAALRTGDRLSAAGRDAALTSVPDDHLSFESPDCRGDLADRVATLT